MCLKRNKKDAYLMMIQGYALSFDHEKLFCEFSTELPSCQNSNKTHDSTDSKTRVFHAGILLILVTHKMSSFSYLNFDSTF